MTLKLSIFSNMIIIILLCISNNIYTINSTTNTFLEYIHLHIIINSIDTINTAQKCLIFCNLIIQCYVKSIQRNNKRVDNYTKC